MAKRTKQLSFAEFGQAFIEQAVTPAAIRQSLMHIVPTEQQLTLSSPTEIQIVAHTAISDVVSLPAQARGHELHFEVPLAVHLALTIDILLGEEQYAAVVTTSLRLTTRTLAPLTIYVDCAAVEAEHLTVTSEGQGNWFDLAKRLGGLDDAIRQQVADMINAYIHTSLPRRTIDVRSLIAHVSPLLTGPDPWPPRSPRKSRATRRATPDTAAPEQATAG